MYCLDQAFIKDATCFNTSPESRHRLQCEHLFFASARVMVSIHWTLRKFSATTIDDVLPGVLSFTLIAASKPKLSVHRGKKTDCFTPYCSGDHRF